MTQYAVPVADISKTDWSQRAGDSDADAFDELDEGIDSGVPDDDTTAWQTATLNNGETRTIECTLGSVTDPGVHTGHIFKIRARASGSTGVNRAGVIYVYQGTTLISTSDSTTFNLAYATKTHTISEAEAGNITDYTDLRIRAVFTWGTAGTARSIIITGMEAEFPDAAGGSTLLTVQDATLALAADSPGLTQKQLLAVADAALALTADNVALTQKQLLAVQDATLALAAENVTLVVAGTYLLTVQDATLALAADSPTLTQKFTLTVADATMSLSADNVALVQAYVLAVADATLGLGADSVILVLLATDWVMLTLHPRTDDLTLDTRSLAFTVAARTDDLTLDARADDLTLYTRSAGLTVETRE